MSNLIVLITGASSGFGALTARALARTARSTVYAGMRETVSAATDFAAEHGVDLRAIELDVNLQGSVDQAVKQILHEHGRIDILIHNAGHMVVGPAEAFTPEQLAELYDVNVLSTQRVNRAVPPEMRRRREGLGHLGVELERQRRHAAVPRPLLHGEGGDGLPRRQLRRVARPMGGRDLHRRTRVVHQRHEPLRPCRPPCRHRGRERERDPVCRPHRPGRHEARGPVTPRDARESLVSDEIARIVLLHRGRRPFRVHIDPADDGSERVSDLADAVRREFLARVDLADLLTVTS